MAKVANGAKRKKNGYKFPKTLPLGEIFRDIKKREWRLGSSIGKGGFGEIYSAQDANTTSSTKYPFVIKIEPMENGPLFVEMHFYTKVAKQEDIDKFKIDNGLPSLGMPHYIGSGSHTYLNEKYRFIVMQRFGLNIETILQQNKIIPTSTVFKIAYQIINVLEYIHKSGYVHADIKGTNILLDSNESQVYLVDFGLVTKFSTQSVFKVDPRKAHNGTIEFLSRDAHQGVFTRRGDIEILIYNMIHWLNGTLPWESNLVDTNWVHNSKVNHMSNLDAFIKTCFKSSSAPASLVKLLQYVDVLTFNQEPDYNKIRTILKKEIELNGDSINNSKLIFVSDRRRSLRRRSSSLVRKSSTAKEKSVSRKRKIDTPNKKPSKPIDQNFQSSNNIMTEAMRSVQERIQQRELQKKSKSTNLRK